MTQKQYEERAKQILEIQMDMIAKAKTLEEQQNVVIACANMMNNLNTEYLMSISK